MPKYPDFFRDHAVLPPGICEPTDRTAWELLLLAAAPRVGEEPSPGGLSASFVRTDDDIDYASVGFRGAAQGANGPALEEDDGGEDNVDEDPELVDGVGRDFQIDDFLAASGDFEHSRDVPSRQGTDAIAWYAPWHLDGDDWGIYFWPPAFARYLDSYRGEVRKLPGTNSFSDLAIANSAGEMLRAHELTHFAGEILGTELEATFATSGYRDYILTGSGFRNPWTVGHPEEILATHREATGAPPGLLRTAAKAHADKAPAGYREWKLAMDARQGALIEATLAAQMMPCAGSHVRWPVPTKRECNAVPVHWDPRYPVPPFLRRRTARITPRLVHRYLRAHGFELNKRHTAGHHYWYEHGRVIAAFSIQGGEIPPKERTPLAQSLGFSRPSELVAAIEARVPPPAVAAKT